MLLEYHVQDWCYSFHSDWKQTIYSSGLATSFCYHIPHLFHNGKSWLCNHISKMQADWNRVEKQALHPMHQPLWQSNNAETSVSTSVLRMQTWTIQPRTCILSSCEIHPRFWSIKALDSFWTNTEQNKKTSLRMCIRMTTQMRNKVTVPVPASDN